jgi:hypothetical protein
VLFEILRNDTVIIKANIPYETVELNAAPEIPHLGIKTKLHIIFITNAIIDAIVPISGLPLPDKSDVKILEYASEITPGSNIIKGLIEGKYATP